MTCGALTTKPWRRLACPRNPGRVCAQRCRPSWTKRTTGPWRLPFQPLLRLRSGADLVACRRDGVVWIEGSQRRKEKGLGFVARQLFLLILPWATTRVRICRGSLGRMCRRLPWRCRKFKRANERRQVRPGRRPGLVHDRCCRWRCQLRSHPRRLRRRFAGLVPLRRRAYRRILTSTDGQAVLTPRRTADLGQALEAGLAQPLARRRAATSVTGRCDDSSP
mmetsp:Transcript_14171/g.38958  ORF Transcript_14171/g.38958 Transcript_14171/m.38958 type:complete len:221 (-) Transcript_14171:289-951(-)